MKAARRKLEVPMPAAMPRKIPTKSIGETHRNNGKRRTKYACVVDAGECTRPRLKGAGHKPHQDHSTAKRMSSTIHYSLVRKFIPIERRSWRAGDRQAVHNNMSKYSHKQNNMSKILSQANYN